MAAACLLVCCAGAAVPARPHPVRVDLRPRAGAGHGGRERSAAGVDVTNIADRRLLPTVLELPVGDCRAPLRRPEPAAGAAARGVLHDPHPAPRRDRRRAGHDPARRPARRSSPATWRGPPVTEILVRPPMVPLDSLGAGLLRDLEGVTTDAVSASDLAFHALREYVPGDDLRHIHWRSSAKVMAAGGRTSCWSASTSTPAAATRRSWSTTGRPPGATRTSSSSACRWPRRSPSAPCSTSSRSRSSAVSTPPRATTGTRALDAVCRAEPGDRGLVPAASEAARWRRTPSLLFLVGGQRHHVRDVPAGRRDLRARGTPLRDRRRPLGPIAGDRRRRPAGAASGRPRRTSPACCAGACDDRRCAGHDPHADVAPRRSAQLVDAALLVALSRPGRWLGLAPTYTGVGFGVVGMVGVVLGGRAGPRDRVPCAGRWSRRSCWRSWRYFLLGAPARAARRPADARRRRSAARRPARVRLEGPAHHAAAGRRRLARCWSCPGCSGWPPACSGRSRGAGVTATGAGSSARPAAGARAHCPARRRDPARRPRSPRRCGSRAWRSPPWRSTWLVLRTHRRVVPRRRRRARRPGPQLRLVIGRGAGRRWRQPRPAGRHLVVAAPMTTGWCCATTSSRRSTSASYASPLSSFRGTSSSPDARPREPLRRAADDRSRASSPGTRVRFAALDQLRRGHLGREQRQHVRRSRSRTPSSGCRRRSRNPATGRETEVTVTLEEGYSGCLAADRRRATGMDFRRRRRGRARPRRSATTSPPPPASCRPGSSPGDRYTFTARAHRPRS